MKASLIVLTSVLALTSAPELSRAAIRAHEWGTFTSLVGSDGQTVHGMYHEDEELPDFVHGFGEVAERRSTPAPAPMPRPGEIGERPCRGKSCFDSAFYDLNLITQKMETPVIYFYTDQKQEDVSVNVKFPEGILTETYPAPLTAYPARSGNPVLRNGELNFGLRVLQQTTGKIPAVPPGNIYSHARNVESHVVKSLAPDVDEAEKFLFYRGLGRFYPELRVTSAAGNLTITSQPGRVPLSLFLLYVGENGEVRMTQADPARAHIPRTMIEELKGRTWFAGAPIFTGLGAVRKSLISALDEAGLNADEATAMIDTWEHGYLQVPGLRILYILPREEVDRILPLKITPAPVELERVFIGRLEILLDTDEIEILLDVLMRGEGFDIGSLGRFAEPKLRRVLEAYRQREYAAGRMPAESTVRLLDALITRAAHATPI